MNKNCNLCGLLKPISEFYKNASCIDGVCGTCKPCFRDRVTANRIKNIDRVRAHDKERSKLRHRKKLKAEHGRRYCKKKFNATQIARRWFPDKEPCVVCGSMRVIRHHPNYDKPRQIVFLCHHHHALVHASRISILPACVKSADGLKYCRKKKASA